MRVEMLNVADASPRNVVAPAKSDADAAAPLESQANDPAPTTKPTDPPSRLLENLASGHFNPVAALRLRANHADKIRAAGLELSEPAANGPGRGRGYEKALAAYRGANPVPAPSPAVDAAPGDIVA